MPAGTPIVAQFVIVPNRAVTVKVLVKVAVPPGGRLAVPVRFPDPPAMQPPAGAEQAHVPPVRPAGTVSVTGALVTELGPALDATIVYVTVSPVTTEVTPSVFVMLRLAWPRIGSVSVALLLPRVRVGDAAGSRDRRGVGERP